MLKAFCQSSFRSLTTLTKDRGIIKLFEPLQQYAPVFYTQGENIKPLYQPTDFYSQLKANILSAKERVFIAALYIGQSEQELVDTIRTALEKTPTLKVSVLIDCLRGTRVSKGQSSATLLLPLVRDFPDQINIAMYHTPDLNGILKKTLPPRFNESIGLMHLKVYGFDNSVMLSGANLSTDYFTNRQDRYMMFNNQPHLSAYYHDLVKLISNCSYQLSTNSKDQPYALVRTQGMADPVNESQKYKQQVNEQLVKFMEDAYQTSSHQQPPCSDTVVLPVIQMGPFYVRQDERLTLALLNLANHYPVKWTIHLTSGYFNFTEKYKQVILQTKARFRFLTASPEANGFFNSKGVSRFLPPAYTFIERQFYRQVKKAGRQDDISIEEYKREGWTYHAKGLWVSTDQKWPSATMIGSPNFGQRSSERDLEAQALVVTENLELRKALYKEVDLLHQHSEVVSNQTFDKIDRKVPNGVKIATAFVKTML